METATRWVRVALGVLGGRLAVLAVVMLAGGWLVMGPLTVARHAADDPFRVDYLAFDTAAQILRDGDGGRLYDTDLQREMQTRRSGHADEGFTAFLNPPIVGAAFMPLSSIPARAAYVVTAGVLAIMMAGVFVMLLRLLEDVPRPAQWAAAITACGSTAVASALIGGQLTPVLLAILLGALLLFRSGRVGAAGFVLGLLCIKPHFAIGALIVLLLVRQWKATAYMAGMVAACGLVSLALVGIDGTEGYMSLMRQSFSDPASVFIDVRSEQNLRGLLATVFRIYGGTGVDLASNAIAVAVLIAVAVAITRAPYVGPERLHYVAALGAVLVCGAAPHIQYYDMALLTLPALFIVRRAFQAPPQMRGRFYGVLVLLVLWIEIAGILAGGKMSVSIVPLLGFVAMMCWWPVFERWLLAKAGGDLSLQLPPIAGSEARQAA
jgi:hypothetical protein